MAAGHAAFLSRPAISVSTQYPSSLSPSSTTSCSLIRGLKLPVARVPRAALFVSRKIVRKTSVVSVPLTDAPFAWTFQNLEIRDDKVDKDAEDNVDTVRSKSKVKSIWETLNDDVDGCKTDITAKLPWMDPSLRYANVMWFKGAYNAQIFVSPGESEDSIVRRFRHAVAGAGVLRECYRRRYHETPQDVIKRKQRQSALDRKRRRQYDKKSSYEYTFTKESSGHNKKTTKKKEARSRPGCDTRNNGTTEKKAYDSDDDDFWGYTEQDDHR